MNSNKRFYIFISSLVLITSYLYGGNFQISGDDLKTIVVNPEKNTGLNKIFVIYDITRVTATYTTDSGNRPIWYRYSNLGGGYAEEIKGIEYSGNMSTLANVEGDMGYIIEDGDDRYYCWVVDYKKHRLDLTGVVVNSEQDCGSTHLLLTGIGEPIKYYTINGQQRILDQQIQVIYNTLEWSDDLKVWNQIEVVKTLESYDNSIHITPAPLCNTTFTVRGDCFLEQWNWIEEVESETFNTNSVDVVTDAEQIQSDNEKSNQISSGSTGDLGGSAPADITFYAYRTDAIIHNEWQMTDDPEFENILYRFTTQDFNYVFTEEGTLYVRFVGSNSDGSCEVYGDTYTITIGASELKCPNAFSPNASEGVNDEWKVSYKSIIEFECWIFNRWGVEV